MAGIYLHIPFCRQACTYCNFHFNTSLRLKPARVVALQQEAVLQKDYLEGAAVETIYFGGGTPSLLSEAELNALMQTLHKHFNIQKDAEITLEANPDNISMGILKSWQQAGINRLSVGVQSFDETELRWMNRAHNAAQARLCIDQIKEAGFDNFSIDLIYGSPFLTHAQWQEHVAIAVQYGIPHLSCYALTVEPKTLLHQQIIQRKTNNINEDKQAEQFLLLMQWLSDAGYEHYEVSNFAKPGLHSRHNSAYWKGAPYLGLGPSAHSYNGHSRQWNIAHNAQYIAAINDDKIPAEKEILTATQKLNEYIMIRLRMAAGISLTAIEKAWGFEKVENILRKAAPFIRQQWMMHAHETLQLTREGMLRADGIAAALFF